MQVWTSNNPYIDLLSKLKWYTSLQIAAVYDHTDLMSTLMENGADPNVAHEVRKYNNLLWGWDICIVSIKYII